MHITKIKSVVRMGMAIQQNSTFYSHGSISHRSWKKSNYYWIQSTKFQLAANDRYPVMTAGILERGGPVRGRSPEPSAERASAGGGLRASPRNFWKIRCDFLQSGIYFWDQNGLEYHSKLGLCWTKNSSGHDFHSHTHTHTPPHFQKLLGFRPL